MDPYYKPEDLFLEEFNYDHWYENEKLSDATRESDKEQLSDTTKTPSMPPLEDDKEELKEGKRLKI